MRAVLEFMMQKLKADLYQLQVISFQAHMDSCRECQQAKFNGNYCLEGFQIMADLQSFFKPVENVTRAAA